MPRRRQHLVRHEAVVEEERLEGGGLEAPSGDLLEPQPLPRRQNRLQVRRAAQQFGDLPHAAAEEEGLLDVAGDHLGGVALGEGRWIGEGAGALGPEQVVCVLVDDGDRREI